MSKTTPREPVQWTEQKDEILRASYENNTHSQLAEMVGGSVDEVTNRMRQLALKKSHKWSAFEEQYLESMSATTSYAKIGKELGRTASAVIIKAARMGISKPQNTSHTGRFSKGHKRTSAVEIGTVKRFSKGTGHVTLVKTAKGWVPYPRHVWETAHGAIPAGMLIGFKDGDNSNCDLSNLVLLGRGERPNKSSNKSKRARTKKEGRDNG